MVRLRRTGEEGFDEDVTAATTVGQLKARNGLQGWALRFRSAWKDADTTAKLGAQARDVISLCKSGYINEGFSALLSVM